MSTPAPISQRAQAAAEVFFMGLEAGGIGRDDPSVWLAAGRAYHAISLYASGDDMLFFRWLYETCWDMSWAMRGIR